MVHRTLLIFAAVLTVTLAASMPARSADTPPAIKPARAKSGTSNFYEGQFSLMANSLQLSAEQKAKIKELSDSLVTQTDNFRDSASKQIADDNTAAYAKTGAERDQLLKQLRESYGKSRAAYDKLVSDGQAQINAQLLPDQRIAWEAVKLYHALAPRLATVFFSDDQRTQLKTLIDATAKDLAATPDGLTHSSPITGKLIRKIVAEILTEQQAALFVIGPVPAIVLPNSAFNATTPAKPVAPKPVKDNTLP